jgi:hypothetical protein
MTVDQDDARNFEQQHPTAASTLEPDNCEHPITESASDGHRIEDVLIDDIRVGNRLRAIDSDEVEQIAESIARIGLQTPPTVRETQDGIKVLVFGVHRLEAAKSLGWSTILCRIVRIDDRTARLWEISENLHRANLTVLERAEQLDEWMQLTREQEAPQDSEKSADTTDVQSAQFEPIESKRADGRGHRKESGTKAAARGLGIERNEAQRAAKRVNRIPLEIRNEIRAMPSIANSGVELDALANASLEQQAAAVTAVKTGKAKAVRAALAQLERGLKAPTPEPGLPISAPSLTPSGDPTGENPEGASCPEEEEAEEAANKLHEYCIQLDAFSEKWNDQQISDAIDELLDTTWDAPDAPKAGNGDPAVVAKLTIATLKAWLEKLLAGSTRRAKRH